MEEFKITIEVDSASLPVGVSDRNELYDYALADEWKVDYR